LYPCGVQNLKKYCLIATAWTGWKSPELTGYTKSGSLIMAGPAAPAAAPGKAAEP
jgi:hypothetical protein